MVYQTLEQSRWSRHNNQQLLNKQRQRGDSRCRQLLFCLKHTHTHTHIHTHMDSLYGGSINKHTCYSCVFGKTSSSMFWFFLFYCDKRTCATCRPIDHVARHVTSRRDTYDVTSVSRHAVRQARHSRTAWAIDSVSCRDVRSQVEFGL